MNFQVQTGLKQSLVSFFIVLAAAALTVAGGGFAAADDDAVGQILLEIERPQVALEQIRLLAQRLSPPSAATIGNASRNVFAVAMASAIQDTFESTVFEKSIKEATAGHSTTSGVDGLQPAAEHFAANAGKLQELAGKDPKTAEAELRAKLDPRPDRRHIEELTTLMAGPQLQGEIMLTAQRIEYGFALTRDDRISETDENALESIADEIIAKSRNQPAEKLPLSRERGIALGKARLRAQLAFLSPEDVAALYAFYTSDAGREAREAMLKAFITLNDQSGKAMLVKFVRKLKTVQ